MPDIVKIMPTRRLAVSRRKSRVSRQRPVVAIIAYEGVNAFELGLAVEVFGLTEMGADWYSVVVCSEHPGRPLATNNGIAIMTGSNLNILRRADIVIVPGCLDTKATPSSSLLDALRRAHRRGARVVSICSGVFVLAAAGLLDGRRAAGHWAQTDELSRRYPAINVDPNVLYADEGDIMSSAGRAAGLDLCIHIVRCDYGAEVANRVAQRLIVPSHREGGQAQFIPSLVHEAEDNALAPVFAWVERNLDRDLKIARLASRASMSRRTFIRRFEQATGMSPGEWVVQARILRARELLEGTQMSIEHVASVTGFGSADALRHHFRRKLGTSPARYRTNFRHLSARRLA
ncbi:MULTISPECIES: helix-turn-helix domain-containing protein [unclassified Bradyrhizobium]|uniref:helix-turn-helix domain-containing protein n=1 Tax=unclassified Bradyrhizobium TaxID=2631580 RepID=UPI00244C377C|nr:MULTISPECIES: helix-turn-helix domain-containing protein [unclassified Bradyrhizobium]MDH2344117.1 helix-turn-helix domain-containing protein [Bradyrhizobium sp. SSUT77]MDH2350291.1 helix-turn-helix domain-containing protein [Bradyrhizobium sp. SSUT112]